MKKNKDTKYIDLHIDAPIEDVKIILDKLIKEDEMKKDIDITFEDVVSVWSKFNVIKEFDKEFELIMNLSAGDELDELHWDRVKQFILKALADQKKVLLNQVKEIVKCNIIGLASGEDFVFVKDILKELKKLK